MTDRTHAKRLEKFYTKPEIARQCIALMEPYLDPDTLLIEPSAGSGAFVDETDRDIIAIDIAPEADHVIRRDFLTLPVRHQRNVAFIGNPPFGKHKKLAADFINHGLKIGHTVGFILPITFRNWSCQRLIDRRARLVFEQVLPSRAFTFCETDYEARCVFQVWTMRDQWADKRLIAGPVSCHPDFNMIRLNLHQTEQAFCLDWDFALNRTGGFDYSEKLWFPEELKATREYILLKSRSADALRRLLKIDYADLSCQSSVRHFITQSGIVERYKALTK